MIKPSKRTLIQCALINGMCLFGASSRNGGERVSAELDVLYRPTVTCYCVAVTQRTVA